MKVDIGPYVNWFGPYQLCDLLRFVGVGEDRRRAIAERIPAGPFNWLHSFRNRKIKVHIDDYDVWSADHTLALITHPLLLKLREKQHGSPHVDDEDAPEHLRGEEKLHERWGWVLDEIIHAFQRTLEEDWEDAFHEGVSDYYTVCTNPTAPPNQQLFEMRRGATHTLVIDHEGLKKEHARISNGFRLFGKYYQGLWD